MAKTVEQRTGPPAGPSWWQQAVLGLPVVGAAFLLDRWLGGWWDRATEVALVAWAVVAVVRGPSSSRFFVASVAGAIVGFVLLAGLLLAAS